MKRFVMSLVALVLVLSSAACRCPAQKASVAQIEATHELVSTMLLGYVDNDAKLTADEKARRHALVDTDRENIQKLKAALGD